MYTAPIFFINRQKSVTKGPLCSQSGYASSPDGNFDVIIPPRFQPEAGGRYYPRPESTEEAKARMMHMEAQLSQLTGNHKIMFKMDVNF